MTKPTGRPKGRPKGPEYTTLMARVPEDLADQAKRYASLHRQTISDVLRDGLLVLLQGEDVYPSFTYDRKEGVSPARPAMLSDNKGAIASPTLQEPAIASDTKEDTATEPGILSDSKEGSTLVSPENVSDTKPAMKQCRNGHAPYEADRAECPTCVRERKRRQREKQPQAATPLSPIARMRLQGYAQEAQRDREREQARKGG